VLGAVGLLIDCGAAALVEPKIGDKPRLLAQQTLARVHLELVAHS